MKNRSRVVALKLKPLLLGALCALVCLTALIFGVRRYAKSVPASLPRSAVGYVVLASCDIGMKCFQEDFSSFLILPPGNTLRAQVFYRDGDKATLVNSGVDVFYKINDNSTSADKVNFWEYAESYGYNVEPNIGITGSTMSGNMALSEDKTYYVVTQVPVTPFRDANDDGEIPKADPYQLATITVTDQKTGEVLAQAKDVVVPVSTEMKCSVCHGVGRSTDQKILKAHDRLSGTRLAADLASGKRYKCGDCHMDPATASEGKPNVPPLSQAMHEFHSDKMALTAITPECYACHPGPETKCYRGVMAAEGINCVNSACHGDMEDVAQSISFGRTPWVNEPDCVACHGDDYTTNEGKLYRNSVLENTVNAPMNGFILCTSCHNSPHAEWPSTNPLDNLLPKAILGTESFIDRCTACHAGLGKIHDVKP